MKKSLLTRCIIPFLLSSTSAFAYEDDATATKAIPVVRALPTGSAHPENELTITATFDDLINRQFDIRMKETIEKFKSEVVNEIFGLIAPVGHVLITGNPKKPSDYGYIGNWVLVDSDAKLVSSRFNGVLPLNVTGLNSVSVPLPAHSHNVHIPSTSFYQTGSTGVSGEHTHGAAIHDFNGSVRVRGGTDASRALNKNGEVGYPLLKANYAGTIANSESFIHSHGITINNAPGHAHSFGIHINIPAHNGSADGEGVNNPTIDLTGRNLKVYMWKRIS